MQFYNTFYTQFELLPRITIIYGKGVSNGEIEITHNGFAVEWLWFGVFFNIDSEQLPDAEKHQCNCSNTRDRLDCGFECYNK